MEYDKEFLKKQLSLQGIKASDEDINYVQHVLSVIRDGEEDLSDFDEEVESSKIILTMDMEELKDD